MTTCPKKAVALLSSGLDSSIALSMARQSHEIVLAITFDYGQRAVTKETLRASQIAKNFGIKHQVLSLPWFSNFHSSALLNGKSLPTPTMDQLEEKTYSEKSAKAVWVPNRNGVFIEIAAGFAEEIGATDVVVGFNQEEAQTFSDNSLEYLNAITKALSYSTANCIRVISPTVNLSKSEIVRHALREDFPLHLLWSCYDSKDKMCGKCESCMRLKRALHANAYSFGEMFEDQNIH